MILILLLFLACDRSDLSDVVDLVRAVWLRLYSHFNAAARITVNLAIAISIALDIARVCALFFQCCCYICSCYCCCYCYSPATGVAFAMTKPTCRSSRRRGKATWSSLCCRSGDRCGQSTVGASIITNTMVPDSQYSFSPVYLKYTST